MDHALKDFLNQSGFTTDQIDLIPGDASRRHYYRLHHNDETRIVMDSKAEIPSFQAFVHVANYLAQFDLSAPRIIAADPENGYMVLEDFGDQSLTKMLKAYPDLEYHLYEHAVLSLVHLQKKSIQGVDLPPYNVDKFWQECALLTDWYAPAINPNLSSGLVQAYENYWQEILNEILKNAPQVFVLRDYHVDNLMWLEERAPHRRMGLLDFQDALIGPAAYDLVSLLQDARRDVPSAMQEQMLQVYFKNFPDMDQKQFMKSYWILGVQRHCKVLGIFSRLKRRDGKGQYLTHIPRLWRYINFCMAQEPSLLPLKKILDEMIQPSIRSEVPYFD